MLLSLSVEFTFKTKIKSKHMQIELQKLKIYVNSINIYFVSCSIRVVYIDTIGEGRKEKKYANG